MKKQLFGLIAVFVAAGAIGAHAATMTTVGGTPLGYAIHNTVSPDGDLVLDTDPGGFLVDYTSSSTLHNNGSSGGFAKVTGVGGIGGDGFSDLTIDPRSPILGFSAIKFNLIIPGPSSDQDPPNGTDYKFDTRVYFVGGTFQDFLATAAEAPDRYIVADAGQTMTSIVFSNLIGTYNTGTKQNPNLQSRAFNFDGIEQVSFNAVFDTPTGGAPEPAAWAMMLVGFGGMGAMLRRRQRALA